MLKATCNNGIITVLEWGTDKKAASSCSGKAVDTHKFDGKCSQKQPMKIQGCTAKKKGVALTNTNCGSKCWANNKCNGNGSVQNAGGICSRMCHRGEICPNSAKYFHAKSRRCFSSSSCKSAFGNGNGR